MYRYFPRLQYLPSLYYYLLSPSLLCDICDIRDIRDIHHRGISICWWDDYASGLVVGTQSSTSFRSLEDIWFLYFLFPTTGGLWNDLERIWKVDKSKNYNEWNGIAIIISQIIIINRMIRYNDSRNDQISI